jgi:hypothetical protein
LFIKFNTNTPIQSGSIQKNLQMGAPANAQGFSGAVAAAVVAGAGAGDSFEELDSDFASLAFSSFLSLANLEAPDGER